VNEPDHDVTAVPGDCLSEVPAEQLEREATSDPGEDPGGQERV